ncbi:hypothetical protein BC629DRAFT_962257 [Irpex lacteus]|nr:hypothetical protein BC629DRAFT_962257 [Irpex lacteus]
MLVPRSSRAIGDKPSTEDTNLLPGPKFFLYDAVLSWLLANGINCPPTASQGALSTVLSHSLTLSPHLTTMFGSRIYLVSALACIVSMVSAGPVLEARRNVTVPQRNSTTGARVNSTSSANNTRTGLNVTINNQTITGTNGGQAACDRGVSQWCTREDVVKVDDHFE